ncbi:Hypothetical protein SMAX5B_000835, partial [Scophthalmus maximus]
MGPKVYGQCNVAAPEELEPARGSGSVLWTQVQSDSSSWLSGPCGAPWSDRQGEASLLGGAQRQQLPQVSQDQVPHAAWRLGASQSNGFWEFGPAREGGVRAVVTKRL